CERGFIHAIRIELAKLKAQNSIKNGKQFVFSSLQELYSAAATIELGLAPTHGRRQPRPSTGSGTSRGGKKRFTKKADNHAHLNRLEMSAQGAPVNTSKKQKSTKPKHSSRGGRGGRGGYHSDRGNDRGGRGGHGGRVGYSGARSN